MEEKKLLREGMDIYVPSQSSIQYKTLRKPPQWYNRWIRALKQLEDNNANSWGMFAISMLIGYCIFYGIENYLVPYFGLQMELPGSIQEMLLATPKPVRNADGSVPDYLKKPSERLFVERDEEEGLTELFKPAPIPLRGAKSKATSAGATTS
jgi:hypothetical protein